MVDSYQDSFDGNDEMIGREEDDKLRTIECLRGRLQAERVASKATKEEADNLAKRLDDLEKKLAEETKCKDRAEKRLQYALKKLKSLELLDDKSRLEVAESSVSSSSSQCLSDNQISIEGDSGYSVKGSTQEDVVTKMQMARSEDGLNDDVSGSCSVNLLHDQLVHPEEGNFGSVGNVKSNADDDSRSSDNNELAIVVFRESYSEKHEEQINKDDNVDNMLALVPVSNPPDSVSKPKSSNNVHDVLLALRKVKEQLLYTMKRRGDAYSQKEIMTCQRNIYGASFQCQRVSYEISLQLPA